MIPRFIFLLVAFSSLLQNELKGQPPVAKEGLLDLREYAGDNFVLKLNGEWEFYWNQILRPVEINNSDLKPDYYGKVPSYWTDYPDDFVKTEKSGCATYHLRVLLPADYRKGLAIDMPVFDSSYDLYLNSEYLGGNGIPGKSASESKPGYRRNFFRFIPGSDTLSLIINVSNFDHRRGGFWLPVEMGTIAEVEKRMLNSRSSEWAAISLLMGFSIFFFFFYLMFPNERIMAFFSIVTVVLGLRPFFTSHFLILDLFEMNWNWIIRFEYFGLFAGIVGGAWYTQHLYPSKVFRVVALAITALFSVCFSATLILPVRLFSYSVLLVYPTLIFLLTWLIYSSFRGLLKKNVLDLIYFLAFTLLIAGAVYDIKISLGHSGMSGEYTMSYIIILFIVIQASLLLYKWVKSYNEKERLQLELEFINHNLEHIVNDRTRELKVQKEEIELQNKLIAQQNTQLSDTLQIRNKIFSVISHDLRSPVVNILYMLHLLKENELKDQNEAFLDSSIEYSQRVIDLIENMLVWGMEQEDKIKYSPSTLDIADIVFTNLSIFRKTASTKDISVNFTKSGNTTAFVDKDLLDIVIRNLISNAVKYSYRGGIIEISLTGRNGSEKNLYLKISDNGTGIPESKQKHLFNGQEISSTPGTENEKGTGLGLKLCHELILINKGKISVESKEGGGTCFKIILPVEIRN